MKRIMTLSSLLLILVSGVGHAEETPLLTGLEKLDLVSHSQATRNENTGDAIEIVGINGSGSSGPSEFGFEGLELKDEELDQIRGGALDGTVPEFNYPNFSKIILWDEARVKEGENVRLGGSMQDLNTISTIGR